MLQIGYNYYKSEPKEVSLTQLQTEKAFLEGQLSIQKQITDSLISTQQKHYIEFKQLPTLNTIRGGLNQKYDKEISNIIDMPTDSTIDFFTEWLAEIESNR